MAHTSQQGPTLFGLASAWAADPINNAIGRRGTIFLTGLFCVFPVLAQAFTQNWWGLLICRMFMVRLSATDLPGRDE